jgi:hypothetical protein
MDRRYQVFISSTYTDLAEERREVIQALLEMDCLPAGMEMFPATSDEQWTLIQQVIDESDYYVVIVGGRYGSTTPEGISYTEKEYDYAVETGKPVLGFVHAKPEEIALGKSQPEMQAKMDAFRAKVMSRLVKPYTSASELGSVVSRSMIRAIKQYPAEGWVRGQHAMTPETQAELAELRAKVKELELEVQASTIEIARIPEDLASGEDTYDMEVVSDYVELADMDDPFGVYDKTKRHTALVTVTWNQIIGELGIRLIDEASEEELAKALNNFARRLLTGSHADLLPSDFGEAKLVGLPQPVFDRIMLQLFALNLTEHGKKPRGVTEKNKYWALTELGKDTLMKLRAIKKQPAEVAG